MPVYGPLNRIVPPEVAWQWLEALMRQRPVDPTDPLAAMQLARRTGDRYRDVSEKARQEAAAWLEDHQAPPHFGVLVRDGGQLDQEDQGQVFGEALPVGLRIV